MPRAAVRNSLVTAVVGKGTSTRRPNSSASSISFCMVLTVCQAGSGSLVSMGERYITIGEATALLVITSIAAWRGMPLFSASRTLSENASMCTARPRFMATFITMPVPFSPR